MNSYLVWKKGQSLSPLSLVADSPVLAAIKFQEHVGAVTLLEGDILCVINPALRKTEQVRTGAIMLVADAWEFRMTAIKLQPVPVPV